MPLRILQLHGAEYRDTVYYQWCNEVFYPCYRKFAFHDTKGCDAAVLLHDVLIASQTRDGDVERGNGFVPSSSRVQTILRYRSGDWSMLHYSPFLGSIEFENRFLEMEILRLGFAVPQW